MTGPAGPGSLRDESPSRPVPCAFGGQQQVGGRIPQQTRVDGRPGQAPLPPIPPHGLSSAAEAQASDRRQSAVGAGPPGRSRGRTRRPAHEGGPIVRPQMAPVPGERQTEPEMFEGEPQVAPRRPAVPRTNLRSVIAGECRRPRAGARPPRARGRGGDPLAGLSQSEWGRAGAGNRGAGAPPPPPRGAQAGNCGRSRPSSP